MRRLLVCLVLLSIACQALSLGPVMQLSPRVATPTLTPIPADPTPSPKPVSTSSSPLTSNDFIVHLHPDGPLYVGDQVSLEVIPLDSRRLGNKSWQVQIQAPGGQLLGPQAFGFLGIGKRLQATFTWAWKTAGLQPGSHTLTFSILPDGPTWSEQISLLPSTQVLSPEPQAHWETAETDCCLVRYITGTEVERDLPQVLEMVNTQARKASQRFNLQLEDRIPITFLPRVLGHGGFANYEIAVSYLDRNYAGSSPEMVLHHEMIHLLDNRQGGAARPIFFAEGVAVYLSGGHFKPEPLIPRAAVLLSPETGCQAQEACGLDRYINLRDLADDFYHSQHEIGYLEASSLVEFMVETWGWQAFWDLYRDIQPQPTLKDVDAIDTALQKYYDLGLDELESRFLEALRQVNLTPDLVEDVAVTIDYYDAVRRYQNELDPSAYFMTAWLPDASQMRQRGIVADFLRRPSTPQNEAVEILLVAADSSLRSGDYPTARQMIVSANALLDVFTKKQP